MICGLCKGAQNLVCLHGKDLEWHECPGCGGAGVRALYSKPTYRLGQKAPRTTVTIRD